jgi:site-specific DNA recombinase
LKAFLAAKGIHGSNDRILSRGALYHILNNRIYLGEIVHKKQIYPGQHKAIIDRVLWDKVVEKLKDNNPVPERNVRATESSLLAGLVFDVTGVRYTPTHAVKRGKRYRYYTSQSVIQRKEPAGIPRIPARDLEKVVETRIHALLTSPDELVKRLKAERVESLKTLAHQRTKEWGRLDAPSRMGLVKSLLTRVVVLTNSLEIEISHNALKNLLTGEAPKGDSGGDARTITCKCSIEVTNHAGSVQVISESAHTPQDEVRSLTLLKAFIRARQWHERIIRGEISSFQELGKEHGVTGRYIPRIFWTASLAPAIIESLVNGRPSHLSLETFRRRPPLDWQEQQARL